MKVTVKFDLDKKDDLETHTYLNDKHKLQFVLSQVLNRLERYQKFHLPKEVHDELKSQRNDMLDDFEFNDLEYLLPDDFLCDDCAEKQMGTIESKDNFVEIPKEWKYPVLSAEDARKEKVRLAKLKKEEKE